MKKNDSILYMPIVNYALIASNIEDHIGAIKHILVNDDFLYFFNIALETIKEKNISYPKTIINNLSIINNCLKNNNKNIDKIIDLFKDYDNFSDDLYLAEYQERVNSLLLSQKKSYIVWNKKEIEEAILFDYVALKSLLVDDDIYKNNYFNNLILKKEYLFSINKYLLIMPELFTSKKIKERVVEILNYNNSLLKEHNFNTITSGRRG